jgi:hypothetical protein
MKKSTNNQQFPGQSIQELSRELIEKLAFDRFIREGRHRDPGCAARSPDCAVSALLGDVPA